MSTVVLRDYQEAILTKLREAFRSGHKRVMLYAPTGAGKTEMAIDQLNAAKIKGNRAAMILDRIVLCEQTSARLQKYSIDHGVMQAGHWRNRPYEHIQVCSAQTLEKRGSFPGLKLLIVDEAHTQRQQTTEFIKNNPEIYVVGLSASPFAEGLGDTYTSVVSATTTKELVDRGMLCPLRVFICKEVDMTGAKKVAGEWSQKDSSERGRKITGDIVTEWAKKTHEIFGGPRKTIVFCSDVAHGADLAQKFGESGYNFVPISYQDSDQFKQDAVKDFSRPDSAIHGLIACDILTKGFDVPDVMIGVSARPFTKSFMSHVQQMGRVMRAHDSKKFALWLDHAGNYLRFQDDWDDLYENGVSELKDGKEKAKKEPSTEDKEAAKCPNCGALWIGRGNVCSSCGHVRPVFNKVEQVAGEMQELGANGKKQPPLKDRQHFYDSVRAIVRSRGKQDGYAAMVYKDKFGSFPPWGWSDRPLIQQHEVGVDAYKFEQSRRIAFAKSAGKTRKATA
jgi:DNA repair protein RadD